MEVVEISIRVMGKGKQPNKSFTVEKKNSGSKMVNLPNLHKDVGLFNLTGNFIL